MNFDFLRLMGWVALCMTAFCSHAAQPASEMLVAAIEKGDLQWVQERIAKENIDAILSNAMAALHVAAHHDQLAVAQYLLDTGADPNIANRYGVTPLMLASANGDNSFVSLLLKAGADPNKTSPEGETPLMLAARAGKLDCIDSLLEQGADPNATESWEGQTALMWAAAEGHAPGARRLLDAGARIDDESQSGLTAFLFAVRQGKINVARALLQHKAWSEPSGDTELPSEEIGTFIAMEAEEALLDQNTDSVNWLRVTNPDASGGAYMTTSHAKTATDWEKACELAFQIKITKPGDYYIAAYQSGPSGSNSAQLGLDEQRIREHGFEADSDDWQWILAELKLALGSGDHTIRIRRREAGWNIDKIRIGQNRKDLGAKKGSGPRNRTPINRALHIAVRNAHYELAALLLDSGADPNVFEKGYNALHAITWIRRPGQGTNRPAPTGSGNLKSLDFVRLLVEKGIDIDARMTVSRAGVRTAMDFEGATALLLAARTADTAMMRLLLELGADPKIPNTSGTTPLLAAAGVGVQSPKEDPGSPEDVYEAVTIALEAGCDVNKVNRKGESVMHGAAYKFAASTIPLLASHGANMDVWNTKNKLGWTPLRIAIGVHRGMNLRSSPEVEKEIRKLMDEAGVSTYVEPETNISGATK